MPSRFRSREVGVRIRVRCLQEIAVVVKVCLQELHIAGEREGALLELFPERVRLAVAMLRRAQVVCQSVDEELKGQGEIGEPTYHDGRPLLVFCASASFLRNPSRPCWICTRRVRVVSRVRTSCAESVIFKTV